MTRPALPTLPLPPPMGYPADPPLAHLEGDCLRQHQVLCSGHLQAKIDPRSKRERNAHAHTSIPLPAPVQPPAWSGLLAEGQTIRRRSWMDPGQVRLPHRLPGLRDRRERQQAERSRSSGRVIRRGGKSGRSWTVRKYAMMVKCQIPFIIMTMKVDADRQQVNFQCASTSIHVPVDQGRTNPMRPDVFSVLESKLFLQPAGKISVILRIYP